jgi:hypothetical protein
MWGNGSLSEAEECRRLAQQCLIAARNTKKKDLRAALLQRAQVWLELAQWQEEQERALSSAPPPSPTIQQPQPVQQQQQQVQPKKDKNSKKDR